MDDFITITTTLPARKIDVPIKKEYLTRREPGDVDLRCTLLANGAEELSIVVHVLLRATGEVVHWKTRHSRYDDEQVPGYTMFVHDMLPDAPPTEAQTRALAELRLNRNWPFGMSTPNNQVCVWAFPGMNAQDVSDRYGSGEKVVLAGPRNT